MAINEHTLKIVKSGVSAGVSRLSVALAPLITTPLLLNYLGVSDYGLWMLLVSYTSMLSVSDLGIANGITNSLARSRNDAVKAGQLVTNAYVVLFMVSVALIIVSLCYTTYAAYGSSATAGMKNNSFMILAVFIPFCLNIPLGLIQRILNVDHRSVQANSISVVASVLSVAIAYVLVHYKFSKTEVVLGFSLSTTCIYVIGTLMYFKLVRPAWLPHRLHLDKTIIKEVMKSGRKFLLLSTLVVIANQMDYSIVALTVGIDDVTPYSIASRMIGIATATTTMLGTALWPVFSEAIHLGRIDWVRSTVLKLNLTMISLYIIFILVLLFGYQTVVNAWLGTTIPVSKTVLFHLGGLSMLIAISSPYFMVLNSKDIVMPQILMYVVLVSIAIPLKYFLGKQFGVEAIAAVGFYSWLAIIIPWVMFLSNRALKES